MSSARTLQDNYTSVWKTSTTHNLNPKTLQSQRKAKFHSNNNFNQSSERKEDQDRRLTNLTHFTIECFHQNKQMPEKDKKIKSETKKFPKHKRARSNINAKNQESGSEEE
ncbi:hypothetical protein YC2023_037328 [Brassica napus]